MKVHCLFEQSGTFKKEFHKLGIDAEDYDIQDEFGETDHVCDLFAEIRGGYEGKPSIFDTISEEDLIFAFFPCVRFEAQILLGFRGELYQFSGWTELEKLEYDLKLHKELHEFYSLITMLSCICYRKHLRMIIENPYATQHYLSRYWCLKPSLIDYDRTERGDYFSKPTQYWFINCQPKNNFIFEITNDNSLNCSIENAHRCGDALGEKHKSRKTSRSLIHPEYANRFIREFIL